MKNFDWTEFTRKMFIEAPIENLYNAWAKPDEIERWFLSDATFLDNENKILAKNKTINKGLHYQWQWYLYDVTETGKVTKANHKDHIQFTFAGNCLVDIYLKEFENGTIITLTQKNIPTDNNSKYDIRLGCDRGWSFYLVNLKSVYEGGLDLRNKNPKLKPMLNN